MLDFSGTNTLCSTGTKISLKFPAQFNWLELPKHFFQPTSMLGHEITALTGIDHARTLAVVQPANWRIKKEKKREKLLQYAERVWGITEGSEDARIEEAILKTEDFFHSLDIPTKLSSYDLDENLIEKVLVSLEKHGMTALSEHGDVTLDVSKKILRAAL